jgi:hypothetical protein
MTTYLYRAVALETCRDEFTGELDTWPGATLGRATGYLSRSSAVAAGERSGVEYVIVKSDPVVFRTPLVVEQARRIDDLEEHLANVEAVA